MNFLGIDIGGTFIKYAIINNENLNNKKVERKKQKSSILQKNFMITYVMI